MRRGYDILKIYKRVFQIIYLCVLFFQICVYVFVPLRSYSKYFRDKNQYDIVQAKVEDEEKYPIGLSFLGEITKIQVSYEIGKIKYNSNLFFYSDGKLKNTMSVAVLKTDPIVACLNSLELPFSMSFYNHFFRLIVWYFLIMILFKTIEFILTKRIQCDDQKSFEFIRQKQEDYKKSMNEQIKLKRQKILNQLFSENGEMNSITQIEQTCRKYNIKFNEEFMWCLLNLTTLQLGIIGIDSFTGEESIGTKTNELRERGLPEKYYVISEQEGYYICGCKETPRLFCFSTNLGITNTIYEDIYDYILAQIDSANL